MTVSARKKRVKSWDITEYLRREIRLKNLAPDTPIMSTRDLVNHFNASLVTANRALNTLVDEGMIYRVQGSGSYVKGKNKPTRRLIIGLIESLTGQERNGFYAAHGVFIDSCLNELRKKHCDVRYFAYQNLIDRNFPKESLDELDGLIVNNCCIDKKTLPLLEQFSGPVTLYGNQFQLDLPFNQIIPDPSMGFRSLFKQLNKSLINGIITMSVRHSNADIREKYFIDAALRSGYKREDIDELEVKSPEDGNVRSTSYIKMKKILSQCIGKLLFTTSDFIAFGAIDAMREAGIEPGRDLQLVSYDNLEHYGMRPFGEPIITSIDHPKAEITKRAVNLTIGASRKDDLCQHIIKVPTHLVIRKTGVINNS
jgi:GntR family transcriptional regulator, arabinose operon transcriptional repressor